MSRSLCFLVFMAVFSLACRGDTASKSGSNVTRAVVIELTSPAFKEGGMIPKRFTCDDQDISPPLSWTSVPDGTKSLAVVCDDPDAPMGTWVHWVLYNLPPDLRELREDLPPLEKFENGAAHGMTDFHKVGYGGPCPPRGTHRYVFRIYALDIAVDLDAGATKAELMEAMEGHIVGRGRLTGRYGREARD